MVLLGLLLTSGLGVTRADDLTALSGDFWRWRAIEQPFTGDDIPRIERPPGFTVDWSAATIEQRLQALDGFEQRWRLLEPHGDTPIAMQVDHRLIGSAIARVRWELAVNPGWRRNPGFYIDQTLGSVFELLLPPPPFDAERERALIERVSRIPATLFAARQNLTDLRRPFGVLAIQSLADVRSRLDRMRLALEPSLSPTTRQTLRRVLPPAIAALEQYRQWLGERNDRASPDTAIGREAYEYFLHDVALLPYTPERMLAVGAEAWARSVAFESYQAARLVGVPPATLFPSAEAQIKAEATAEQSIRDFLVTQHLLHIPRDLPHYRNQLLPDYLAPIQELGVTDDLTGPTRATVDAVSYIRTPRPDLGFFYRSTAQDPRPIVVHEGVPGHFFQLWLGWQQDDPIRRHYYDSASNEGIGFYAEEMMLQAGLFDDAPRTRGTIYSFMRLRALRVEVDVKLALGVFTLQQAAEYLARTVPMDQASALEEAALFASTPGQAISYQIGKSQLTALLADARRHSGDAFMLEEFNDFVWRNGNVPFALQRWELLGDPSELPNPLPVPRQQ